MDYSYKDIKVFPFKFYNPYKKSKDEVLAIAHDSIEIGQAIQLDKAEDSKKMMVLIAWGYKATHHSKEIFNFRCNVIYDVDYSDRNDERDKIDELIKDSHKRAGNEFKKEMIKEKSHLQLKDAPLPTKYEIRNRIIKQIPPRGA